MTIFNQETLMTRAQFRAKYDQYKHPEAEFCDDFFYPVLDISQDVLEEMVFTGCVYRIHGDEKEIDSLELFGDDDIRSLM